MYGTCDMSMYIIICVTQIMIYNSILLGTLNFVTLYSAVTLSNEDDAWSSSISTDGGFPFGTGTIYSVYVRKHSHFAREQGMFRVYCEEKRNLNNIYTLADVEENHIIICAQYAT